jgi:hypothetical protein
LNAPFTIKLQLLFEVDEHMLIGISPVIQLLDRTSVFKLSRVKRESGIDPYKFMLLRIIYCSALDEVDG